MLKPSVDRHGPASQPVLGESERPGSFFDQALHAEELRSTFWNDDEKEMCRTDSAQLGGGKRKGRREDSGKKGEGKGENEKKKEKAYSTGYSQAVTHPSTNPARRCLTSVIGREPVFSPWYGRRHLVSVKCSTHQKLATRLRAPSSTSTSVRTQGPHHRSRPFGQFGFRIQLTGAKSLAKSQVRRCQRVDFSSCAGHCQPC